MVYGFESMDYRELVERLNTLNKEFESVPAWDTSRWTVIAIEISEIEDWLEFYYDHDAEGQEGDPGIEDWFN